MWEWSCEVTAISLAPLGMISQRSEPGSTGTLAEGRGRHSEGETERAEEWKGESAEEWAGVGNPKEQAR